MSMAAISFTPTKPRTQWDHETLVSEPWDMANTHRVFHESDTRFKAGVAAGV